MIKVYDCGYKKQYKFRPNHDKRKNYGSFELYEYGNAYAIWSLSIIEEQRGKGYGAQMLTEFLEKFNANKPLFLYVNKANEIAIRLYKKVGFAIVGDYSSYAYTMKYMNCT